MSDTYNGIFLANNDGTGKEYGGGGGNSGSGTAVLYTEQTLTSEQKEQARSNIDSASISELENEVATRSKLGTKNLLPNNKGIHTHQGITFTPNSEGKIIVSGEASADAYYIMTDGLFFTPKSGSYVISVDSPNPDIRILVNALSGSSFVSTLALTQAEATITIDYSNYDNILIGLIVNIDTNLTTPVTVSPMLRLASDADDTYEPYAKTNKELTDGTSGLSNENLLDNPFFTVNERGQSSYSGHNVICFDRWRIGDHGSVSFNNGILTITKVNIYAMIYQFFDPKLINALIGKKVTASVTLDNNSILKGTTTFATSCIILNEQGIIVDFATNLIRVYSSTATFAIKNVKLEIGEVSTLALDTIPNYNMELAKCQTSTADPNDTYANKNIVTSASIKNISIGTSDMTTGVTVLPTGDLYIMYE